jgi:ABC-type transport system involved in multi-copper enzyme maturation permease subunit
MNLNLRLGRGSFHPAWFLLLLPPLLWRHDVTLLDEPWFLPTIGILPALLLLVPLSGFARRTQSSFSLRLSKEFRTQLPAALLAIVTPSLVFLSGDRDMAESISLFAYAAGCVLMGATAFGSEFEQRTIGYLLTQPFPRSKLYRDKLLVMGLLLAVAATQIVLGNLLAAKEVPSMTTDGLEPSLLFWVTFLAPPVFAFCSGPMLSLRTRSTLAGAVFTAAIPLVLILVGQLSLSLVWKLRNPGKELTDFAPHIGAWCYLILPLWLAFSAWFGWHTFKTLELRGEQQAGSGSHPLAGLLDGLVSALWPSRSARGTAMLIRKELRLHVVPWLVSSLLVLVWGFIWFIKPSDPELMTTSKLDFIKDFTLFIAVVFGGMNLCFIGSASIAEERQLGTLDWQLTCPATVRRQWWVKVGVTFVLSVLLGIALPLLMVFSLYGAPRWAEILPNWVQFAAQGGAGLGIIGIALYGSSISKSTIKAACSAIVFAAGITGLLCGVTLLTIRQFDAENFELSQAWENNALPPVPWTLDPLTGVNLATLSVPLAPVLLLSVLLWFAASNFRRGIPTGYRLVGQLLKMGLILACINAVIASALGYLMLVSHHNNLAANPKQVRVQRTQPRPQTNGQLLLDPALVRRYGLTTNPGTNGRAGSHPAGFMRRPGSRSDTNGPATLQGNPGGAAEFRMDPAMARRYGLTIRPQPPTNAAPAKDSGPSK